MVVNQDQRAGADFERLLHHLARMDRGLVDRAIADQVIEDQAVTHVEIEYAHPFVVEVGHVDRQVVDQRLPAAQNRLLLHDRAGQAARGDGHDPERGGAGLAHAGVPGQRCGIGVQHSGKGAEPAQQRLGQRLHVLARDGQHQQVFDQLVVSQRVGPAAQHPRTQTGAVARSVVRRRASGNGLAGTSTIGQG